MTELAADKLVFIDESGFDTKMTRRSGRSARGKPCIGAVPHGHWRNTTFIAGLRRDRIDAPMMIDGAMDGDAFRAWVEQSLAPTLEAGNIVICDNLNVHKNVGARAAIEARGAELRFLPPYSPDLNPIEHLWDVLNKQVRSMEAPPRNLKDLKDLLLTSWCQTPQHTFRGLVESMPRRVRAVLTAKGRWS